MKKAAKKRPRAELSDGKNERLLLTKHAYCVALMEFLIATLRKALDKDPNAAKSLSSMLDLHEHGDLLRPVEIEARKFVCSEWVPLMIGEALRRAFQRPDGKQWNCLEWGVVPEENGEIYTVLVQRKSGKTPNELLHEANARIEQLEAKVRELVGVP